MIILVKLMKFNKYRMDLLNINQNIIFICYLIKKKHFNYNFINYLIRKI